MARQIELEGDHSLEQCQSKLRGIESRRGRIIDLVAEDPAAEGEIITLVTATRERTEANSLHLVMEGGTPPDGTKLEIAGTAWIDDAKAVVKIYR